MTVCALFFCCFFFFKQKTAYEMRISDWSSDVCSSDLVLAYILSGTAGLYVSDLPYLLASRVVLGLSAAMIQITAFTLINTRLAPAARAQWMGMHISAAMIGTILVQPVAGFIGDYSWRWP